MIRNEDARNENFAVYSKEVYIFHRFRILEGRNKLPVPVFFIFIFYLYFCHLLLARVEQSLAADSEPCLHNGHNNLNKMVIKGLG